MRGRRVGSVGLVVVVVAPDAPSKKLMLTQLTLRVVRSTARRVALSSASDAFLSSKWWSIVRVGGPRAHHIKITNTPDATYLSFGAHSIYSPTSCLFGDADARTCGFRSGTMQRVRYLTLLDSSN